MTVMLTRHMEEIHTRQMSVVEAFVCAGPSSQTTQTTTLRSETQITRSSRGIQSLKELFPTKNEHELRQAVDVTGALEEAINLLIHAEDRSMNDSYGSLLRAECGDDTHTYHDEDELSHQSKTLYTVNDKLAEKLQNWKELNMDTSGNFRMKVRRHIVCEDPLTKLARAKDDMWKPIKVQFLGEPTGDQGGPSREYFGLVNSAAPKKLMSHSSFRHNISALQGREYYAFGQLTALGLLQGCPDPRCFSRTVVDYILTGGVEDLKPSTDEIPNHDIKTSITQ